MSGRAALLLWMTILLSPGCAHFAKVPVWQSSSASVEGVQSVVVLPFEGEWGNRVSEEVSDAIANDGCYSIIDSRSIPQIDSIDPQSSPEQLTEILSAARQADIDAVLTGTIVEEHVEPTEKKSMLGLISHRSSPQSAMTVDYWLIDTRTGETLFRSRISCQQSAEKQVAMSDTQDTLIQRCGLEVVSQLTPQTGNCQMALANCSWMERGGRLVRQGVRAAEQGKWEDASNAWEAARVMNPSNDEAIFNLALAAAYRGNFAEAEELALEAIRIRHCDCYEKGLGQIRQQMMQLGDAHRSPGELRLTSLVQIPHL